MRRALHLFLAAMLSVCLVGEAQADARECYELRIYEIDSQEKQAKVAEFLKSALFPALHRQGIDRLGAFKEIEATKGQPAHSLFVLIPYKSLEQFAAVNDKLEADNAYQSAAADYFSVPKKKPHYTRVKSSLMLAFAGMPTLETPVDPKGERIFEIRTYESHQAHKAKLKVEMFNKGEIDIMKNVKLGPVFFGEALIGSDLPQLTYMLSAKSREAHAAHWKDFIAHPDWKVMAKLPRYKATVSKITKWYIAPLPFSEI